MPACNSGTPASRRLARRRPRRRGARNNVASPARVPRTAPSQPARTPAFRFETSALRAALEFGYFSWGRSLVYAEPGVSRFALNPWLFASTPPACLVPLRGTLEFASTPPACIKHASSERDARRRVEQIGPGLGPGKAGSISSVAATKCWARLDTDGGSMRARRPHLRQPFFVDHQRRRSGREDLQGFQELDQVILFI